MRNPKFHPDQQVFYRHVVADDKLFTARVVEYINTQVNNYRYDQKTDTYHYKIHHPIHQDMLIEVPEYDLFNSYADAIKHDRFI